MDLLNLIFGIIGVISFAFAIFAYRKDETKKAIEAGKNATQLEQIRGLKNQLGGIYSTIDMMVQLPKQGNVSTEQFQNLARVARKELRVMAKQIEMEEAQLLEWKYGQFRNLGDNQDQVTF